MHNLEIKVLTNNDWQLYKSLRLLALKDSPDSFGSTYVREIEFSDDEWISRLDPEPLSLVLSLVAWLNDAPVGIAWGLVHDPSDHIAHVYQMWVSVEARNQGVGTALLSRIIKWASQLQLEALVLCVTTVNQAAVKLYLSTGFVPHGDKQFLRPGSNLHVQPMLLSLVKRNFSELN